MRENRFTCVVCGAKFTVPESTRSRYPLWQPKYCMDHRQDTSRGAYMASAAECLGGTGRPAKVATAVEEDPTGGICEFPGCTNEYATRRPFCPEHFTTGPPQASDDDEPATG